MDFIRKNINLLSFIGISLLGVCVRFSFIDYYSLDLDEAFSLYYAQGDWAHLSSIFEKDITPPTYYVALYYWMKLVGFSIFNARLLSLIFSSLTAGVIYLISSKHINRSVGVIAALLFILSSYQFEWGTIVRAYPMTMLFATLSIHSFLSYWKEKKSSSLVLLGVYLAITINTHSSSIILIPIILILGLFFLKFKNFIGVLISAIGSCIFLIPQIVFFNHDKIEALERWRTPPEMIELLNFLMNVFQQNWMFILFLVSFLTFGFVWKLKKTHFGNAKLNGVLFIFIGLSLSISFLTSQFVSIFYPKYLLFLTPVYYIVIASFLWHFALNRYFKWIISVTLIIIASLLVNFKIDKKENWKAVVEKTKPYSENGYDIAVSPLYMYRPFTFYYSKELFQSPETLQREMYQKHKVYFINKIEVSLFEYRLPEKLILIQAHKDFIDPKNESQKNIETLFEKKNSEVLGNIQISYYELNKSTTYSDSINIEKIDVAH